MRGKRTCDYAKRSSADKTCKGLRQPPDDVTVNSVLAGSSSFSFRCFRRDVTSDGFGFRIRHGLVVQDRLEREAQVALRRFRSFLSKVGEGVINAAAIQQFAVGCDDGDFRCDCDAGFLDEFMRGIEQGRGMVAKFLRMLLGGGCGKIGIRIDEVASDFASLEFSADAIDLRRVAIGNGAIMADEKQHRGLLSVVGERLMFLPVHIDKFQAFGSGSFRKTESQNYRSDKSHGQQTSHLLNKDTSRAR